MVVDKSLAESTLREAHAGSLIDEPESEWEILIRELSTICANENKTHIAFLGTALLAKATDLDVDVFAVKARTGGDQGYSARSLGHGVLVPVAGELGIDLGVTGREPLNNQPYFRIDRISKESPVHSGAKSALYKTVDIIEKVAAINDSGQAARALRAFLRVRREFGRLYEPLGHVGETVEVQKLASAISALVSDKSEGGKRAQACAAGLLDVFASPERVEVAKINDPDRHIPGDVGVRSATGWERMLEVRDKKVVLSDLMAFARKCHDAQIQQAVVICAAQSSPPEGWENAAGWCSARGISLDVYCGWNLFTWEVMTWSGEPAMVAAALASVQIHERLIDLEASEDAVNLWNKLLESLAMPDLQPSPTKPHPAAGGSPTLFTT